MKVPFFPRLVVGIKQVLSQANRTAWLEEDIRTTRKVVGKQFKGINDQIRALDHMLHELRGSSTLGVFMVDYNKANHRTAPVVSLVFSRLGFCPDCNKLIEITYHSYNDHSFRVTGWCHECSKKWKWYAFRSGMYELDGPRAFSRPPSYPSIKSLGLSIHTLASLKHNNIETIGDLLEKTEDELFKMPKIGKKSFLEIKNALIDTPFCLSKKGAP